MLKKYLTLFLICSLTAFAQTKEEKQIIKQAFANRDKYLFAAKPAQKNFSITVPFTMAQDIIIIPVTIAGENYHFMFDTGAVSAVSNRLKDKLGLKQIFSNNLQDGAGTIQNEVMYTIGNVEFAGVTFNNVVGPAFDLDKFEKLFCIKIDGILGTNMMRTCRWKIDYNAKTLTFSDKKLKPEGKVQEIDFRENFSGTPEIRHVIGEYNYWAIMDTGYNGTFVIPDSLFFKSRISKKLDYKKGRGVASLTFYDSKPVDEYVTVADTLYVGNVLAKNQLVRIAPQNMAITGNAFFKNFGVVMIDWNKSKIYVPDAPVKENTEMKTFGFTPAFVEDVLKVGMVWETSSAGKAGIRVGDTILSINGKVMKGMPKEEWCQVVEMFLGSNTSVNDMDLVVAKVDGTEYIQLKKTNLFEK